MRIINLNEIKDYIKMDSKRNQYTKVIKIPKLETSMYINKTKNKNYIYIIHVKEINQMKERLIQIEPKIYK